MASRNLVPYRIGAVTTGTILLLLVFPLLICGCLDVEPEELPPLTAPPLPVPGVSPMIPADITKNISSALPAITISGPKKTVLYTELQFPVEIERTVSDFVEGRSTDTINAYLRWESVRARTNRSDAAGIEEQIRRIDSALFDTPAKENVTVYIGISGEQAKRIRNDSVYRENGYLIGSYDPSVIYHRFAGDGRDKEGYLTICIIESRRGSHFLVVNTTEREILLPRGGIWDFAHEDTYEKMDFSAETMPRYKDIIPTKVRLIYTKEHP